MDVTDAKPERRHTPAALLTANGMGGAVLAILVMFWQEWGIFKAESYEFRRQVAVLQQQQLQCSETVKIQQEQITTLLLQGVNHAP